MVYQMYKEDGLEVEHIQKLVQRFGNQSLDFFGAIRACTYDNQILCDPVLCPLPCVPRTLYSTLCAVRWGTTRVESRSCVCAVVFCYTVVLRYSSMIM